MTSPRSDTAAERAKRWNLNVRHALYRKTGDWYHQLERFPGALLDADGYVLFDTEDAYRTCPELRIRQDVGVPTGIKSIPGYTRVVGVAAAGASPTSYETALAREGARVDVVQSRPERDPAARSACLEAHGRACVVCGIDFGELYGAIGEGFIHVHHLKPLADGERLVDPVADLRPLCPNCHAMVHRVEPPLSIEAIKAKGVAGAHRLQRELGQVQLRVGAAAELPWGIVAAFTAEQTFAGFIQSLPRAEQAGVEALGRRAADALADALVRAPIAAVYAIQSTLASLCKKSSHDAAQRGAFDMVGAGAYALCGDEEAGDLAVRFDAFCQGIDGPKSNAAKIRTLAGEVRACLACAGTDFAPRMPAFLRACIERLDAHAAERISEEDLAALLAAYSPMRGKAKRTFEGVVAQIVFRARLFGTTEKHTEQRVLQRVHEALRPRGPLLKS